MTLKNQVEVEQTMYYGGIKRAEAMMLKAEEHDRASQNPYAKALMREYVMPLAERIRAATEVKGRRGIAAAHVQLLRPLDPDAVAFLACRYALNACMNPRRRCDERTVGHKIGSMVHSELVLAQIEEHNPALYHTLANDLQRRLSKDERHRMTVFKMQAKDAGIQWAEWPIGAKEQVGSWLLGQLIELGMVDMEERRELRDKKTIPRAIMLSAGVIDKIDNIKSYIAISAPTYGPCVEPPKDWVNPIGGGFHTKELRRTLPMLVRCHPSSRDRVRHTEMPIVLACANMLQRTKWRVNVRVLDTVLELARCGVASKEIVTRDIEPKPARPVDVPEDLKPEDMNEQQQVAFRKWKRQVADWHSKRKIMGTRYGRFYAATRAAEMFREYPEIYFVYFADSRGRFYPMTYGVNPQGSDLQKSLLMFADGLPVDTPEAVKWFCVQGANKFGFDKATLDERHTWVDERKDLLMSFADDPINNLGWMQASDPLQFLAWCFEYAEFIRNPITFRSHLPISMDGSCNGLQNLSAMLRDEVGGQATNLTRNEKMEDIYRRVAEATVKRMQAKSYEDADMEALRVMWLEHGVSRSVMKRSVMTTPYGVTQRSAQDYIVSDYLADEDVTHPFDKKQWRMAARVLMDSGWPAIGDVVVKGRQAMDWLKKGGRTIAKMLKDKGQEPVIEWTSPSGFPASQAYFEVIEHRIRTRLVGTETIKMVVAQETDIPDPYAHASGLAPNFVHSMDAAHLHRVAARCRSVGINAVAMIHDDYGTHAANAGKLYKLIREEFVAMYEQHDPVEELSTKYPIIGKPPAKGNLNIREVMDSEFFFS